LLAKPDGLSLLILREPIMPGMRGQAL